jgi:hypothetical protein
MATFLKNGTTDKKPLVTGTTIYDSVSAFLLASNHPACRKYLMKKISAAEKAL